MQPAAAESSLIGEPHPGPAITFPNPDNVQGARYSSGPTPTLPPKTALITDTRSVDRKTDTFLLALQTPRVKAGILIGIGFTVFAVSLFLFFRHRARTVRRAPGMLVADPHATLVSQGAVKPGGVPGGRPVAEFPIRFPAVLEGRYRDPELIGEGGIARIFRAKRVKDRTTVAIKVPIHYDGVTGTHFIRDMGPWKDLHHRNIIEIFTANILPIPFIEMEYAPASLADQPRPLRIPAALRIVRGIADGIAYAHRHGIVHRDIKPENILLSDDGTPKITDWGLAKPIADPRQSSVLVFSPAYAAPEQLRPGGSTPAGPATDIYQLGVLLYELVTGHVPFQEKGMADLTHAILSRQPPEPEVPGLYAEEVRRIILRCLEKRPEDRYRTVDDLIIDLDYLIAECGQV